MQAACKLHASTHLGEERRPEHKRGRDGLRELQAHVVVQRVEEGGAQRIHDLGAPDMRNRVVSEEPELVPVECVIMVLKSLCGIPWSSVAISGSPWHSVVISGNQRAREDEHHRRDEADRVVDEDHRLQ